MVRDIVRLSWVYLTCSNAHLLGLKVVRDKKNAAGLICIASLHIFWLLRWSRTNSCKYFLMRAASLQISWVLKWLTTNSNEYVLMCTNSSHISWICRWSGISCIQFGIDAFNVLLSVAFSNLWWYQQILAISSKTLFLGNIDYFAQVLKILLAAVCICYIYGQALKVLRYLWCIYLETEYGSLLVKKVLRGGYSEVVIHRCRTMKNCLFYQFCY